MLEQGDAAVRVTPLSGVSGRMIVSGPGENVENVENLENVEVAGGLSDPVVEQAAVVRARALLGATYPQSGPGWIADAELFFEIATPPPDLVIFGAGHDAAPVERLAWTLGFTGHRRRRARGIPHQGTLRRRDAGLRALQSVRPSA